MYFPRFVFCTTETFHLEIKSFCKDELGRCHSSQRQRLCQSFLDIFIFTKITGSNFHKRKHRRFGHFCCHDMHHGIIFVDVHNTQHVFHCGECEYRRRRIHVCMKACRFGWQLQQHIIHYWMEIRNVCFEFSNTIFTSTYISCMNGALCIVLQDSYFIYTHLDRWRCRKCVVKLAPYIKSLSPVCDWNCFCIISTYDARQIFCRCFLRKWLLCWFNLFGWISFSVVQNSSSSSIVQRYWYTGVKWYFKGLDASWRHCKFTSL